MNEIVTEAKKRDHRKLGRKLDLFHTQEEAPGMIFWHDRGWTVYRMVVDYIRSVLRDNGYQEVHTPQIVDRSLWEKSGHWDKFGDMIFTTHSEHRDFAIKPMNCPAHIQIYNQGLKSYRDLPLRLAEFGSCHRNEPSGTLHGLMRVRNFVQDDAHIFCTEELILGEVVDFIDLLFRVYADFGFTEIKVAEISSVLNILSDLASPQFVTYMDDIQMLDIGAKVQERLAYIKNKYKG